MRTSDPRFIDFMLGWAIRAGKFPPERRPHYEALFAQDPDGTTALLDGLAPGLNAAAATPEAGLPSTWFQPGARLARPTVREAAAASAPARPAAPAAQGDTLPEAWFPEARDRRSSALAAAARERGRIVLAND